MTEFIKIKTINLLLHKTPGISKIKDVHFTIRCAIKLYINMITTVVV
jgi:hypothetical protein